MSRLRDILLRIFKGPALLPESTDQPANVLRVAQGAQLRPLGGLSRPPLYYRLWQMANLSTFKGDLGLSSADKTVAIKVTNEGQCFIVFYDCVNDQVRGMGYVGIDDEVDPSDVITPPTLTKPFPSTQVLWKGLDVEAKWNFEYAEQSVLMLNGIDLTFIYKPRPSEFRRMADQIRPIKPEGSSIDIVEENPANASYQFQNVLYLALEPLFKPVSDESYQRALGNNIFVSVVQGDKANEFNSTITGIGTYADPYRYMVITPLELPTEDELVAFINRDTNAQGIVFAELVGTSATMTSDSLFTDAHLYGGVTSYEDTDVFAAPQVDVALTYFKKDPTGQQRGFESAPSPIVTITDAGSMRVQVRVFKDDHPDVDTYDAIRIYLSSYEIVQTDQGWQYDGDLFVYNSGTTKATNGFATEGYVAFKRVLEVPNEDGVYTIAPSLIQPGRPLNAKNKIPPPCTGGIFIYGRWFMWGNPDDLMKIHYTHVATDEIRLPEGGGLMDFIRVPTRAQEDAVTACFDFRGQLVAYTKEDVHQIPSTFFETGIIASSIVAGAINDKCIVNWEGGRQLFLAANFNLYELSIPFEASESNKTPVSKLVNELLGPYIQQYADTTNLDAPHSYVDYGAKQWWLWMAKWGGGITSFCYDFQTQELTGPFDAPGLNCSTSLSQADSRCVGADELGNLLFIDLRSNLTTTEIFSNNTSLTLHDAGTENPDLAYPYTAIPGGPDEGKLIAKAQTIEFSTGWQYVADGNNQGGVYEVSWNLIRGSEAYLILKLFTQAADLTGASSTGYSRTYYIGRLFPKAYGHKLVEFNGNPVRAQATLYCGDDLPFAMRDFTISVKPQGRR